MFLQLDTLIWAPKHVRLVPALKYYIPIYIYIYTLYIYIYNIYIRESRCMPGDTSATPLACTKRKKEKTMKKGGNCGTARATNKMFPPTKRGSNKRSPRSEGLPDASSPLATMVREREQGQPLHLPPQQRALLSGDTRKKRGGGGGYPKNGRQGKLQDCCVEFSHKLPGRSVKSSCK